VRKLRAFRGDARGPSAPENAQMVSRCASLRFSLCGRVIRCRCPLLANATFDRNNRCRERCDGHLELPMVEERWPEHRLLKRGHAI
jgi:hypothetical protein